MPKAWEVLMEDKIIGDLVDYMVKLKNELDKKDFPVAYQLHIFGLLAFHQFNGTRNDTDLSFNKIIKNIKSKFDL